MSIFGVIREYVEDNDDHDECAVCFEEIKKGDMILDNDPNCTHSIHKKCAERWAASKGRKVNCPLCRAEYSDADKQALGVDINSTTEITNVLGQFQLNQVPDAVRAEIQARFDALYDRLVLWASGSSEKDIADAIVEASSNTVVSAHIYKLGFKLSSYVDRNVNEYDYFIGERRYLNCGDMHWDANNTVWDIVITARLMNAALHSLEGPMDEIHEMEEGERDELLRLSNSIDIGAFESGNNNDKENIVVNLYRSVQASEYPFVELL